MKTSLLLELSVSTWRTAFIFCFLHCVIMLHVDAVSCLVLPYQVCVS